MKMKINNRIAALILLSLLLPGVAFSQSGYPQPEDDYVNDWARVISDADYNRIWDTLERLEKQTGIEIVVVTVNSIYDYGTGDNSIESFATGLFNSWGVGHKKENNGVLLLVAVRDRQTRIELGGGYGSLYDAKMKDVIDDIMIPYFRQGDYSRGIFEGVEGITQQITKKVSWLSYHKWHILIGILIVVFILAGINFLRKGKKGWGWVFLAAAGFLLIILLKMLLSGNKTSGFGGGSSFGGGASGSW